MTCGSGGSAGCRATSVVHGKDLDTYHEFWGFGFGAGGLSDMFSSLELIVR